MKQNPVCISKRRAGEEKFYFSENFLLLLLADEKLKNIYVVSLFEYFIVIFIMMMQKPLRVLGKTKKEDPKKHKIVRCTCET